MRQWVTRDASIVFVLSPEVAARVVGDSWAMTMLICAIDRSGPLEVKGYFDFTSRLLTLDGEEYLIRRVRTEEFEGIRVVRYKGQVPL